MKKNLLLVILLVIACLYSFGQIVIPETNPAGGPLASPGSLLTFATGGPPVSIQDNWGLNLCGTNIRPIRVYNSSLLVGYQGYSQDFGTGNAYISGNVGIGTSSPIGNLDIRGRTFIGTTDFLIGSTGSTIQIDQGATAGNTYSQIRAFSNGGTAVNNLMLQTSGGNVGIGTTDTRGYTFAVNGSAIATSITVQLRSVWPDYVFKPTYKLPSLTAVKTYIDQNHHLPEMPSEQEVARNGLNLGEIVKLQTKKIEELTLYLIEKDKQLTEQQAINQQQAARFSSQQEQIDQLKQQLSMLIKIQTLNQSDVK